MRKDDEVTIIGGFVRDEKRNRERKREKATAREKCKKSERERERDYEGGTRHLSRGKEGIAAEFEEEGRRVRVAAEQEMRGRSRTGGGWANIAVQRDEGEPRCR